jgi:hypothetical protein
MSFEPTGVRHSSITTKGGSIMFRVIIATLVLITTMIVELAVFNNSGQAGIIREASHVYNAATLELIITLIDWRHIIIVPLWLGSIVYLLAAMYKEANK